MSKIDHLPPPRLWHELTSGLWWPDHDEPAPAASPTPQTASPGDPVRATGQGRRGPRAGTGDYTDDWPQIALAVKDAAGWCCVRCHHPHDIESGHMLTVHHMNMRKDCNDWWNTVALCQRCHLRIQAKVNLDRPWVLPHSEWAKPYIAGFYAWKYLGVNLARADVLPWLAELLTIERDIVVGDE